MNVFLRLISRTAFLLVLCILSSKELRAQPQLKGQWSPVIDVSLVPAAAANLPDGKVLLWSARDRFSFGGNRGRTYTLVFDPATGLADEYLISNTRHDMFCPGTANMPDGRIMVTGGSSSNRTSIYDPKSGQWEEAPTMNITRGYHAMVTLSDGRIFTVGGSWSGGRGGKHAEVFENNQWKRIPGLPVDFVLDGATDPQGVYRNDNHIWLWPAPNGKLFHAGPSSNMHWLDLENGGSYTDAGPRGDDAYSMCGNTVMFDIGKILKVGGAASYGNNTVANNKSFIIDINTDNVQVEDIEDMAYGRIFNNTIVAPNGQVFVFGGNDKSNPFRDDGFETRNTPERFDPQSKTWSLMEPMQVPRNYHSVGLLLIDGRILLGGGGLCGGCTTNHPDVEIFSPPYLFDNTGQLATRPVLNTAPSQAVHNSSISVDTDMPVSAFSLIRLSSVTHSTNNEQRRIPLSFTNTGGNTYSLNILDKNILPPGDYMLFALDVNGVPSIAKIINITDRISPELAHWKLDDDTEDAIGDADGELKGNAALAYDPIRSKVLTIDNDGDHVLVETKPQLEVGKNGADFSVSFWMNLKEGHTGAWRSLIHKGTTSAERTFAMWMRPADNKIHFRISTTASGNEGGDSQSEIPVDQWTHISYVKKGQSLEFYINGSLDQQINLSGTSVSNTGPLYIGDSPWYATALGKFDDVRLFDYAIDLSEVQDLATSGSCTLTNVALNKTASQSSTYPAPNGRSFTPEKAIDGDSNGSQTGNSITHTQNNLNAWWEVDLHAIYDLSYVKIWNREDGVGQRLNNFHVLVSEAPFTSQDLTTTLNQAGVSSFHFTGTAGRETDIALNRQGRYLRIQFAGSGFLHLAEVEVMGCGGIDTEAPSIPLNLAASNITATSLSLNWDASTDNLGVLGYYVYQNGSGATIGMTNTNSFEVTNLAPGTSYRYQIAAVDAEGNFSARSQEITITTLPITNFFAYWPLDNDTEDAIGDADGQMQFGASLIEDQIRNKVLFLPNRESKVVVDAKPQLQVGSSGQDFSVAFWMNLQEGFNGSWRSILNKGALNSQRTFTLRMRPNDNKMLIAASTRASSAEEYTSSMDIPLEKWAHIAYLKEADSLKLYINGYLDGQITLQGESVSNDAALFFGANRYFTTAVSKLDDVRLYGYPLSPSEIFDLAIDRPCNLENVALNKTATQSATWPGSSGRTFDAMNAVDGDSNGDSFGNSITHTANDLHAWWEVDLGTVYDIASINIWNRTDCCTDRLRNFHILISEEPFDSQDLTTSLNQAGVQSIYYPDIAGAETNLAANTCGRYVRVQLAGTGFLQLAEVEINACNGIDLEAPSIPLNLTASNIAATSLRLDWNPSTDNVGVAGYYIYQDGNPNPIDSSTNTFLDVFGLTSGCSVEFSVAAYDASGNISEKSQPIQVTTLLLSNCNTPSNLALNKTATQSSTWPTSNGRTFDAMNAVDGNTNGNSFGNSITHTANDQNAWWEVDLGEVYDLSSIKVWNRTDCCSDRLSNFHIFISSTPFVSKNITTTLDQEGVSNILYTETVAQEAEFCVNRLGRYVRIQFVNTGYLSLAEVEIMGCQVADISFSSKLILEGAYDSNEGLMKDDLRYFGLLPQQDPYGLGKTMTAPLLNRTGDKAIVDWLRLDLYDTNIPSQLIASKACLLLRDGEIIDVDGNKDLVFEGVQNANYFLIVRHYNHLALSTASALDLTNQGLIDFSNPSTTIWGGTNAGILLGAKRLLIAGDANGDGVINAIDLNLQWRMQNGGVYIYGSSNADFNLNGNVNALDKNLYWLKNNSRISILPD
ncbi:MAG: LamG-like jellyroll fold domain-containing protein [Bacteroidota bacterium]